MKKNLGQNFCQLPGKKQLRKQQTKTNKWKFIWETHVAEGGWYDISVQTSNLHIVAIAISVYWQIYSHLPRMLTMIMYSMKWDERIDSHDMTWAR